MLEVLHHLPANEGVRQHVDVGAMLFPLGFLIHLFSLSSASLCSTGFPLYDQTSRARALDIKEWATKLMKKQSPARKPTLASLRHSRSARSLMIAGTFPRAFPSRPSSSEAGIFLSRSLSLSLCAKYFKFVLDSNISLERVQCDCATHEYRKFRFLPFALLLQ